MQVSVAVEPAHTTSIGGVAVRFYVPPFGGPDLPWHSFFDLCAAAQLPHATREDLLRKARSHADIGIVTLPDGTIVQSHQAAIALVSAMIEACVVPPSFAQAYATAGVSALEAMHAGLSTEECFERVKGIAWETFGVELVLPS